jgi:alanine racemase
MAEIVGRDVVASAVVKNNAYGLGAKKVSAALYEAGCRDFWTAYLKEAVDIRDVLPSDVNIYYFQGFCSSDLEEIKNGNIIPVVNSLNEFNDIRETDLPFVLHIDTGFTRIGLRLSEINEVLPRLKDSKIKYIISHLACSNKSHFDYVQKAAFDEVLLKARKVVDVKAAIAASEIAVLGDEFAYDLVRIGAFLYGIKTGNVIPQNVVSLQAKVLQRYEVKKDAHIGYDATYTATGNTQIAAISMGYAEGISRRLSNKGNILFYDKNGNVYKAKILGRISMDVLVCDVTNIPADITTVGSDAFLLDSNYSINEMAQDAETIAYEIVSNIDFNSARIKVEYKE